MIVLACEIEYIHRIAWLQLKKRRSCDTDVHDVQLRRKIYATKEYGQKSIQFNVIRIDIKRTE